MTDDEAFGAGFRTHRDDPRLRHYLDAVAAVPAVADAKLRATSALALSAGEAVLEVGCGTGVDLLALAEAVGPGGAVVGLDPDEALLAVARERLAGRPVVALAAGTVEAMPFEDGRFDACRMDRTLQHVADPERALAEVRSVLVPADASWCSRSACG